MIEVSNLYAGYDAINVLWDLSLVFKKGELTTIIGQNGAGKTTLLRAIMGLIPIIQGDILYKGQSLKNMPTWNMIDNGICLIPEGRMMFRDMSVEDNLLLGAFSQASRKNISTNLEYIYSMFPRLKERRRQLTGSLSGGESQMVAMGRGLMSEPDVLLIDEPSLGLAPVIVNDIFDILRYLKEEGRTIILVEQNTHRAIGVADHVYLMQTGKVLLSKRANDIDLDKLHDLYFARGKEREQTL